MKVEVTCNVYVSIANEYHISEVIQVEVTNSVRCETSHITVIDRKLVQLHCHRLPVFIIWRYEDAHVDSLEVRLCGRSLPTSCVWGNYCKRLALRRKAAAPLSSASCHVVCVCVCVGSVRIACMSVM